MTGTINTQAAEFPSDPAFPASVNAEDFRDLDLQSMGTPRTTDFSSAVNETLAVPVKGESIARSGRRAYANGNSLVTEENTREVGARGYTAFHVVAQPGPTGFPGAPVRVLGEDPNRIRFVLTGVTATAAPLANTCAIGPLSEVVNGGGYLVPAGLDLKLTVTDEVYACVPVGGLEAVTISVWVERA